MSAKGPLRDHAGVVPDQLTTFSSLPQGEQDVPQSVQTNPPGGLIYTLR